MEVTVPARGLVTPIEPILRTCQGTWLAHGSGDADRRCPWQRELLEGLLGADQVGFHVQSHCNNFLETVDRVIESESDRVNSRFQTDQWKPILDIREYTSLAELRADLHRAVSDFCDRHPQHAAQQAFEAFAFCEAVEVAIPLGIDARTLSEFNEGLQKLSRASLHFHFLASRLPLHVRTNDFS